LAKEGSAAYDALSQKFLDEKERQLQALEEQIGARAARRREAAEAKQRAAQGQEEQERKRIQALAEAHLAAQEKFAAFRTTMQKRRRVAFKGGFSQTPLEPFNRT
jgi:parvulin-like peptidyl-prolyl isomerase